MCIVALYHIIAIPCDTISITVNQWHGSKQFKFRFEMTNEKDEMETIKCGLHR